MSLERAQSFRFDVMGDKVWMLYAPVKIVRDCNLKSRNTWNTYFRSSMRILFMLFIFSFFEAFSPFFNMDVSVFRISIFFPAENIGTWYQMR
jgi:hypothetical protein